MNKLALSILLLAPACTSHGGTEISSEDAGSAVEEGITEQELLNRHGEPHSKRVDADGTRYITYHGFNIGHYRVPNTSETVVFILRDGRVSEVQRGEYLPAN